MDPRGLQPFAGLAPQAPSLELHFTGARIEVSEERVEGRTIRRLVARHPSGLAAVLAFELDGARATGAALLHGPDLAVARNLPDDGNTPAAP